MVVVSTSTFRESLKELCKRPKHAYGSCKDDICKEFTDQNVSEDEPWKAKPVDSFITTNNAIINDNGITCLLKIRVACESRKVGKSGGFRLIATINRHTEEVVLLEIFPKTGPYNKSNIDSKELKKVIETYISEREKGVLVRMDITNGLSEIKDEKDA